VQILEQLSDELNESLALKVTADRRIVAAGRARRMGRVLHIGRLTVAPDMQGRGLGTKLLTAFARAAGESVDSSPSSPESTSETEH